MYITVSAGGMAEYSYKTNVITYGQYHWCHQTLNVHV